ncbi:Uncharacterised protein [Vibrio cholerae]|uniref:Uncharacterized protein n=1 Tax=Vibrio cholerae TaxID=666 RepID=A0A655ZN07_VIBCL|nr:Uncharacterised protein [Vibrio cholerae]
MVNTNLFILLKVINMARRAKWLILNMSIRCSKCWKR